jgi:serine/threonine protein kinase
MEDCPLLGLLERAARGLLPEDDDEYRQVLRHLEVCPACERTFDELCKAVDKGAGQQEAADQIRRFLPSLEVPSQPLAAGQKVGDRYLIEWPLGEGGMGSVYRAHDSVLHCPVALKVIHPKVLHGRSPEERRQWLERFRREAQAAARLRGVPHVVQVYDYGEFQGTCYYTMALVQGENLERRVRCSKPLTTDEAAVFLLNSLIIGLRARPKPLTDEEAARLVRMLEDGLQVLPDPLTDEEAAGLLETIALAVQAAHDKGILHRDLKPANVVVASAGPFLVDFGLSRFLAESSQAIQEKLSVGQTSAGPPVQTGKAMLGTLSYMAPEQADGADHATKASDVYGLGAILYFMLTKRAPFEFDGSDPPLVILQQLRDNRPPAVRKLNWRAHPHLEAICSKCLARYPEQRYRSAAELAKDLKRFRDGEPPALFDHNRRSRRARAAIFLAAVGALTTLGFFLLPGVWAGLWDKGSPPRWLTNLLRGAPWAGLSALLGGLIGWFIAEEYDARPIALFWSVLGAVIGGLSGTVAGFCGCGERDWGMPAGALLGSAFGASSWPSGGYRNEGGFYDAWGRTFLVVFGPVILGLVGGYLGSLVGGPVPTQLGIMFGHLGLGALFVSALIEHSVYSPPATFVHRRAKRYLWFLLRVVLLLVVCALVAATHGRLY